jgi:tetratricopeptide (TPR) repeat protein
LIANGRRLQYLGKYKESNELLFSIVNEVKDLETRSALHGNIATNYTEIGIREKAEFHYLKSLHYMKSSKSPLLWKIYANIASFYNSIDQFETGLKYSDSVWISSKTDDAMSFYHVNRAASFKGLERWEDALNSINMTLQLDQKMGEDYYLANDYADRGNIYFELKEFQKAFKDYEVAQKMFEGLNDYSRKSELLKRVVETYLIINNPTIHDHFRNFLQMNDSINQQKLDENFTALDTKFQTAEKEAKIKEQALKLEKEKVRKNQLYYGLGILMLLGLGGFFMVSQSSEEKAIGVRASITGYEAQSSSIGVTES